MTLFLTSICVKTTLNGDDTCSRGAGLSRYAYCLSLLTQHECPFFQSFSIHHQRERRLFTTGNETNLRTRDSIKLNKIGFIGFRKLKAVLFFLSVRDNWVRMFVILNSAIIRFNLLWQIVWGNPMIWIVESKYIFSSTRSVLTTSNYEHLGFTKSLICPLVPLPTEIVMA